MFSQISRIPDLIWKFWAKRCGLYAGVYGTKTIIHLSVGESAGYLPGPFVAQ